MPTPSAIGSLPVGCHVQCGAAGSRLQHKSGSGPGVSATLAALALLSLPWSGWAWKPQPATDRLPLQAWDAQDGAQEGPDGLAGISVERGEGSVRVSSPGPVTVDIAISSPGRRAVRAPGHACGPAAQILQTRTPTPDLSGSAGSVWARPAPSR